MHLAKPDPKLDLTRGCFWPTRNFLLGFCLPETRPESIKIDPTHPYDAYNTFWSIFTSFFFSNFQRALHICSTSLCEEIYLVLWLGDVSISLAGADVYLRRKRSRTADNGYMTPNLALNVDLFCKMGTRQFNEWFLSNTRG